MKTVGEACEATFVYKIPDELPKSPAGFSAEMQQKIADDIEHWRAVDDEIRNDRYVHIFVAQMVLMVTTGRLPLGEALMACAVQFVAVGIEMERGELPLPTGDSVPGRRERGYTGV